MNTLTDWEIIRDFAERRSDAAFAELVRRHLDFVYASALRQVRKPDIADDVAQAVFLLLARKASSLRSGVVLSSWLFRSTRFLSARAVREESRRHRREQEASKMILHSQTPDPSDELLLELEPHLDDAIAALGEADRKVILLRYFERKRLHEVGEALGLSEEATKKRAARAVDKMHSFFSRRGLTLSSLVLSGVLSAGQSISAPAGLAETVRSKARAGAGSAAASSTITTLVAGGLRDWVWFQAKTLTPWVAGAALVTLGATLWFAGGDSHLNPASAPNAQADRATAPAATQLATTAPALQQDTAGQRVAGRQFLLNVRDKENNQPIPDARVLAQVWEDGGVKRSSEQRTEADGSCEFAVTDKPRSFRVWLSAAGYVPLVMDWAAHEFTDSDLLHTCRLTRGVEMTGDVRDEEGRPVAGATVMFGAPGIDSRQREHIAYHPQFSTLQTDEAGQFRFDQIPPEWDIGGGIRVGIKHPNFAPAMFWPRDAKQVATNRLIVLGRGVELRGKIIGPRGEPVPGATVEDMVSFFGLEAKADVEGRFEIAHVTPGEYMLTAQADGYGQLTRTILVQSNTPEVTFQLIAEQRGTPTKPEPIRLVGSVVDAENGQFISRFRVLLDEHRGMSKRLLGESANGAFDWATDVWFGGEYSLEVEAEGYLPQGSDVRRVADGDQKFEFQMKRGSDLTGVMYQPDGQPAAGASVGLQGTGFALRLSEGGNLVNYGDPVNRTITDAQGRFSVPPMLGAEQLLVAHESGCAVLPVTSVTNIAIVLQSWGVIEGELHSGSNPAPNQSVNVGFGSVPGQSNLIRFDYSAKTDTQGKFRFKNVPPGIHRVQRLINFHDGKPGPIGFSHGETVTVRAGEVVQVTLGGKGIPVIGQFVLSPALTNYDWKLDLQALVQDRPDLPEIRRQDFRKDNQAYMRAWSARDSQIAKYYLDIQSDGRFRVDDVLPGQYTLKVKIHAPSRDAFSKEPRPQPQRDIGALDRSVVIPATNREALDEPVDLGVITIPITNSLPAEATRSSGNQ